MLMAGDLPTAFGKKVVCCWTLFSPARILSASSIQRDAKQFRVGIIGDFVARCLVKHRDNFTFI